MSPQLSYRPLLTPLLLLSLCAFAPTWGRETCPEPWVEFDDSCYLFERGTAKQQKAAADSCAEHNALLLSVDSTEEDNFVTLTLAGIAEKAVFATSLKWF